MDLSTERIAKILAENSWEPSGKNWTNGFDSKRPHVATFSFRGAPTNAYQNPTGDPEITLVNSADGTERLQIHAGWYRAAADLHLVRGRPDSVERTFRHRGDIDLETVIGEVLTEAENLGRVVAGLEDTEFSAKDELDIARLVARAVYSEPEDSPLVGGLCISFFRSEDRRNSRFNLISRFTEACLSGRLPLGFSEGARRSTRVLRDPVRRYAVSRDIWRLVEEYYNGK